MTKQDIHTDLAVALRSADPRVLAALVTHMSGNPDAVRAGITDDELRAMAVPVLVPYCTGEKALQPPDDAVMHSAMEKCAQAPVPAEYGPMMRD